MPATHPGRDRSSAKPLAGGVSDSWPRVLLLGKTPWSRALEASLRSLEVLVLKAPWNIDLKTHLEAPTMAVIVTAAPPGSTLPRGIRKLRDIRPEPGPLLLAVVRDGTAAERVRELYRAGTTAVLEWPREGRIFPRLLAEMASVELVRGRVTRPDSALQRSLEAHLRLHPGLKPGIRLDCRHGVVTLSGRAESLWQKTRLQEVLSTVPGVQSVMSRNLWVNPSGRSDRDLSKSVRQLLRDTSAIDDTPLSFNVRNGYLTIAGTISDRQELGRVMDIITHVKGIRGIENLTTVSRSSKQQDHASANRIRKALRTVYPNEEVSVAVFASVAVLSGRVGLLATKKRIEDQVEQDKAVRRVINKIHVAPS